MRRGNAWWLIQVTTAAVPAPGTESCKSVSPVTSWGEVVAGLEPACKYECVKADMQSCVVIKRSMNEGPRLPNDDKYSGNTVWILLPSLTQFLSHVVCSPWLKWTYNLSVPLWLCSLLHCTHWVNEREVRTLSWHLYDTQRVDVLFIFTGKQPQGSGRRKSVLPPF